jgi:hypothetical protein
MTHRFTLDYADDYAFVAAVYEALWRKDRPVFPLADVLALLEERPRLRETNARYAGVVPPPLRPADGPGHPRFPAGEAPRLSLEPGHEREDVSSSLPTRIPDAPRACASTACA